MTVFTYSPDIFLNVIISALGLLAIIFAKQIGTLQYNYRRERSEEISESTGINLTVIQILLFAYWGPSFLPWTIRIVGFGMVVAGLCGIFNIDLSAFSI
jgi:hypothetical protein